MSDAGSAALSRCVGEPDAFLSGPYMASPWRWRGRGFDDLLSMADVDAQLSGAGLRRPSVRLVRDGEVIDPSQWTRTARTGSVRIDDLVNPGKVFGLFADGATIVLQSLQRWWPPITDFCRDLEVVLGEAVQANAYLTPPGAAGLTPHHDTHDVFVLQVYGTKRWIIREPLVVAPLAHQRSDHERAAAQPILLETEMQPGDCLYLPRGYIHSAATQDGTSLHLTIGVLATTVHDVLRRVVERAGDDLVFRRAIPRRRAEGDDLDQALFKEIVADFARWLDNLVEIESAPERRGNVRSMLTSRPRRLPMLGGQLLELENLGSIDDATRLERRASSPPTIRSTEDRTEMQLGDRRLDMPSGLLESLDLLLDGEPHAVGELRTMLDPQSRLVLVRRLVREGVLRTCDGS